MPDEAHERGGEHSRDVPSRAQAVETINKFNHGWRRIVRNFSPS